MTSRNLTAGEIALAQTIFGTTINYSTVLIHDDKYIPLQRDDTVVTPNGAIYFPSAMHASDFSLASPNAQALFIHEMAHVMQYQNGMNVRLERVLDGNNYNYDAIFNGTPFHKLPMEAQAEFLEDLFRKLNSYTVYGNKPGGALEDPGRDIAEYLAVLPMDLPNAAPGEGNVGDLEQPEVPNQLNVPSWLPQDVSGPFGDAQAAASPLIIDLDNDGVEATTFNASTTTTFFDIDNDGFREQTAWVGADDGFLALDLNRNGLIDDSSELFGSATVDGFAILAALDSNGDHVIDANDADFDDLVIWKDANGDTFTQGGELQSLAYWGIASISLAGITAGSGTINGNPVSHTSTVTLISGATRAIKDVWFIHDNVNSYYDGDYELDIRTLFLPTLRGFAPCVLCS